MDGVMEGYADRTEPHGLQAQAGFAALLPTRALPRFTPVEFLKALNRIIAGTGTSAELVPELTRFEQSPGAARIWHRPQMPPRIGATVAGITLLVEGQDRPALGADEVDALGFRFWPAGEREILRARAHFRISEARPALGADLDANHDRAAALTAVAAAALELAQAPGIVWETSGVAVAADEMLAAVPGLSAGEPPVALWIGAGSGAMGTVTTRGLYPLLGAEVELRAPSLARAAAERVAMETAAEILDTGRLPAEGSLIEWGSGVALRVRYREADAGRAPAIVLDEARPGALDPNGPALAAGAA